MESQYSPYEDIKTAVIEMGSKESSIEKALRSFGYERFPEAGLDDTGKNRLIKKIIEIEQKEARLMPTNYREGGLKSIKQKYTLSIPALVTGMISTSVLGLGIYLLNLADHSNLHDQNTLLNIIVGFNCLCFGSLPFFIGWGNLVKRKKHKH